MPAALRTGKRSRSVDRCIRKFLRFFPGGFRDQTYIDWEREYKWNAHESWESSLSRVQFRLLLKAGRFGDIAREAARIEGKTNLLFSFEKMALRDAIRSEEGAASFSLALYDFLYGPGDDRRRFDRWVKAVESLPRRQTRVLTWPLVTVFGFIAQPQRHMFLKPNVTRAAAGEYDFPFHYQSRPNFETYLSLLEFAQTVRADTRELRPRDMIDLQSFIWVQGSDEYEV